MRCRSAILLLPFVLVPAVSAGEQETAQTERARLVVLLAVDQLRRDRADPALPGGIGRLLREGRVFTEGVLDHAVTATCPGHVSMVSGRHPGPAGIPGNSFVERESGNVVYCVADPSPDTLVIGGEGGRSPRNLRVDTLGDWMKAQTPARVFSVSPKDRSAIVMGGRKADGAYWFLRTDEPGFTTSRYYRAELPKWVRDWNGNGNGEDAQAGGLYAGLPEQWTHDLGSGAMGLRRDDYPFESSDRSRTSGHPLRDDDPEVFAENLYHSPFMDERTLDFGRRLIVEESLGKGPHADMLAISLSATDAIGHQYGPESHEARDALLRLDLAIGEFLDFLDRHVGAGRVLVALTADHGVLPLPEWLAETDRSRCPVEGGRAGLVSLLFGLNWELQWSVGPWLSLPGQWLETAGTQLTVIRSVALERGVAISEVVAVTERYLEAQPAIARAWTESEILAGSDPVARLFRNSFDPERSGDIAIELSETCLISLWDSGTGHGSPHLYDRAVPIVFWGPGVAAGRVAGPAATVDIGPTLGGLIGLQLPAGLDGRSLFE